MKQELVHSWVCVCARRLIVMSAAIKKCYIFLFIILYCLIPYICLISEQVVGSS